MKFSFSSIIDKTGINPFVPVPLRITEKLSGKKGYIRVKGKINGHTFLQTLVPVKNAEYRLYVNGPMLKGARAKVGDKITFSIEPDTDPTSCDPKMPAEFKKRLAANGVTKAFKALTPYRQKEIFKYLGFLKTEESLVRNIDKVITQLKSKAEKK